MGNLHLSFPPPFDNQNMGTAWGLTSDEHGYTKINQTNQFFGERLLH
jgi:hypothetical protein